jgi:NAD(P)-dependent dehydrogenase (short-subunit alcohol dehydrogenase family)
MPDKPGGADDPQAHDVGSQVVATDGDQRAGGLVDRGLAVVTGANGGIGLAVAQALWASGHRVALVHHQHRDAIDDWLATVDDTSRTQTVSCDLGSPGSIARACEAIDESSVTALVNNAGILHRQAFLEVQPADFDDVLDVDLRGPFFLTQRLARGMVQRRRGSIVNIGSAATAVATAHLGAYGLAKSALLMFTRILAQELGPYGIRANSVSPGLIRTPLNEASYRDPEDYRARVERSAVKRAGSPDDVAAAVAFLCSDEAGFITGQNLVVDGGSHDNMLAQASWVRERPAD